MAVSAHYEHSRLAVCSRGRQNSSQIQIYVRPFDTFHSWLVCILPPSPSYPLSEMISIISRPSRAMTETTGWNRALQAPLTLTSSLPATDSRRVILFPQQRATAATHLRPEPITGSQRKGNNDSANCTLKGELSPEAISTEELFFSFSCL